MSDGPVAVVLNPASRSGKSRSIADTVSTLAEQSNVEVHRTERAGHARQIASELAGRGFARVVAVGGDGTLNEVANGLAMTQTALAALPAGTGNDWVRSTGVPRDIHAAWNVALNGRVAETDLAEVEGHGYCLNVMGAGFDAEVARRIAGAKGLLASCGPTLRYVCCVLATIGRYPRTTLHIALDGQEPRAVPDCLLVAVGVAQYYGSGMKILPDAVLDDGCLDVVWGSGIGRGQLPSLLAKLYKGRHLGDPRVTSARCTKIEVRSDAETPFHIDGDVKGVLPLSIAVLPKALRIVVP